MDKHQLASARRRASAIRASYLMSVASQMMTIDDVLAAYPDEPALGVIKLDQLLAAQPGVSHAEAVRTVERFRWFAKQRFADHSNKRPRVPKRPTISYLRHRQATTLPPLWHEVLHPCPNPPWDGFPWSTRPDDAPTVTPAVTPDTDDFGF